MIFVDLYFAVDLSSRILILPLDYTIGLKIEMRKEPYLDEK